MQCGADGAGGGYGPGDGRPRQPAELGSAPHPPAVEFRFVGPGGGGATLPAAVMPWATHSQKPSTGMVVAQERWSVTQTFAAAAWPAARAQAASAAAARMMGSMFGVPFVADVPD